MITKRKLSRAGMAGMIAAGPKRLGKGLAEIKPKAPPPMIPGDLGIYSDAAEEARHGVGANRPPVPTARDKLLDRRKELVATASAWLNNFKLPAGIDTDENAARRTGFKSHARELEKEAEEQRKKDQKPAKDEVVRIAAAYAPIARATTAILDRIAPLLTDWLQREQAALDAAARMKRDEAERQRRAAEQLQIDAQRQMDADLAGSQTNTMETIIAAQEQERAAEAAEREAERAANTRAKVGAEFQVGGVKRSASLATVYSYRVDDPIAAATALCQMHPEGRPKAIIEAIVSVAGYLHRQDRTRRFPGITIIEDQEARG